MKTLLSSIAMLLGGCVLLSSCNQGAGLSLTKRHYNKGYYVDINSKRENVNPKQLTIVDKSKNISAPATAIAPSAANATDPNNNTIVADNRVSAGSSVASISPTENKRTLKSAMKNVNFKAIHSIISTPALLTKNIAHIENAPQTVAGTTQDDGPRVHSLFWLVITVILVLWLIGILTGDFGIGILINLLLIVALILLVLWLLWLI
ncbi:MAG TPA: hypothetical protein VK783_16590 [Bacteroidia bacterium]|nr:hypothetical protein [Bacteroidia bacterium]